MPTQTHLHEASRVYTWLEATLGGDATLAALVTGGWWQYVAQGNDRTKPWGVIARASGIDTLTAVGSFRVVANDLYTVKVIAAQASDSDASTLTSAADRVDALLHGANGTTSDGNILVCVREEQIDYAEIFENIFYRHAGGTYRILSQPLTGS